MELKGSKTEANLQTAFAGESQARNKYTYFSSIAKKEGYVQIGAIFEETANNEKEHAKMWFKLLNGGDVNEGLKVNTIEALEMAASGENYEHTEMYKDFAETAKKEGFTKISKLFEMVGKIESHHEERFNKLLEKVKEEKVFKSEAPKMWVCRNC
ncbi:MAG: rubrerythrin family protein, partial [Bacilli bacterium]|nr:rubrerythrin family protein [Bacilli bacterium]